MTDVSLLGLAILACGYLVHGILDVIRWLRASAAHATPATGRTRLALHGFRDSIHALHLGTTRGRSEEAFELPTSSTGSTKREVETTAHRLA